MPNMKTLTLLLCAAVTVMAAPDPGSNDNFPELWARLNRWKSFCESSGFTFGDGLCYYISTERRNWEDSRQWCLSRGSDMIIVNSREKQDFVLRANKQVWIGLNDRIREGSFRWVDGTPLTTPTFWYLGEPNSRWGRFDEDCVDIENYDGHYPSRTGTGRGWNDCDCAAARYWICEKALR